MTISQDTDIIHALSFATNPPEAELLYQGSYDAFWVAVSIALSVVASYAALDAASRIERQQNPANRLVWALVSAFTMGSGVWAMHFIGMLAFELHCKVYYEPLLTLISIIPGILASGVALGIVWNQGTKHIPPHFGCVLLGAGIGAMHYTGMAALRMEGQIRYNPSLFALSILVAVVLSYLALQARDAKPVTSRRRQIWIAVTMGCAISGMHYIAMFAAYFVKDETVNIPSALLTTEALAVLVAITSTILALAALAVAAISRNREMTRQLQINEAQFRSVIESIPDGIFLKNAGDQWLVSNRSAIELFGLHDVDWLNKTTQQLAEQYPQLQMVQEVCLQDEENCWTAQSPDPITEIFHPRHAPHLEYEVRKLPIFDANARRQALVTIVRDITEKKTAETKLTLSASVFEHAREAIMITDVDGMILEVNDAFLNITGYSRDEIIGQNPRLLSSGRHDKEFYAYLWSSLYEQGFFYGEIWNKRKNGEIYPQLETIIAVRDHLGEHTHYVALFSDITERKQAENEIHTLAYFDSLTKLPNRRLLMERLGLAINVAQRSRQYGAVMILDMDKFKTFNDMLGHEFGDQLLIEVAKRIRHCLREEDLVARLGGDEFGILIESLNDAVEQASLTAAMIADKIRAALVRPYQLHDSEHILTPSIGVTTFVGGNVSVDTLLKQADMAMYQAKDSGRNAIRFFDESMQYAVETRAALETDLRLALTSQQLQLYYQVQVDRDRRPIGAEALIRWFHPTRGMVSPAQFIPIAEETSLITEIGDWVIETACRQLQEWSRCEQCKNLSLAVNVSARQFKRQDFVDKVAFYLNSYQVESSRLKLELTESVVHDDIRDVVSKMYALKALNIQLSMDDFGTGYSSLSYLKQMPLDQLKIDQSFVRDMTSDQNDAVMVQTMIDLAKNFHLNVIAEGVETEEQLALLKKMGCMIYQGYLFSKPLPINQFVALLQV